MRKLDYARLIRDYESGGPDGRGLTMHEVAKKNACSGHQVFRILKAAGKSRGRFESSFVKTDGWRRLVGEKRKGFSRQIVIPASLLTKAGLDGKAIVWAKWELGGKNQLKLLLRNRLPES